MLTVAPSPVPYPVDSNGTVDSWTCSDHVLASPVPTTSLNAGVPEPATTTVWAREGQDCAVTHYTRQYPQNITATVVPASEPSYTPFPNGYTSEAGNWTDIGPWFAAVLCAAVLGPLALLSFLRWIRPVMQ